MVLQKLNWKIKSSQVNIGIASLVRSEISKSTLNTQTKENKNNSNEFM